MNLPYTKENIINNDFLFVSYKHEDENIVTDTLEYLLDQGVRLWYDADLGYGDRWPEIVEGLIKHENCRGVIFFNSEESFKSEPVFLERKFAIEKVNHCRDTGKTFLVIPVNIGKNSTMALLKAVFDSLPEDMKTMEREFPLKYIQGISTLFTSDTLYCYVEPEKPDEHKLKLVSDIKKALPTVIDIQAIKAKEIVESFGGDSATVTLGICKGAVTDRLPNYYLTKDQKVVYQGGTYIIEGGVAYETQRVTWRPVSVDDECFVLLSEKIVDVRNGGDGLKEWLLTEFLRTAFTEEEQAEISEVRLLTDEDITKSKTDDLLVFKNSDIHWWLNSRSAGALQKVVKKDGSIYNSGYNFRTKKSGVRPVIRITKEYVISKKL